MATMFDEFRDSSALLIWRVRCVLRSVTDGVHSEVETVQVHRVLELSEVDLPPPKRIALRDVQSFGSRPKATVDHKRGPIETRRALRVDDEPPRDHEDAIVRPDSCATRVHDGSAIE